MHFPVAKQEGTASRVADDLTRVVDGESGAAHIIEPSEILQANARGEEERVSNAARRGQTAAGDLAERIDVVSAERAGANIGDIEKWGRAGP